MQRKRKEAACLRCLHSEQPGNKKIRREKINEIGKRRKFLKIRAEIDRKFWEKRLKTEELGKEWDEACKLCKFHESDCRTQKNLV